MMAAANESLLNSIYNRCRLNDPNRIGYMMAYIRKLRPLTERDWKNWYLENVHGEQLIDELANEMSAFPNKNGTPICTEECRRYIEDVMFRRTFRGYSKECDVLGYLRKNVSSGIEEAPAMWDSKYFVDFYALTPSNQLVGIQLKPVSFQIGNYQTRVDINGKILAFCNDYHALAFVLLYRSGRGVHIANPQIIEKIKTVLKIDSALS